MSGKTCSRDPVLRVEKAKKREVGDLTRSALPCCPSLVHARMSRIPNCKRKVSGEAPGPCTGAPPAASAHGRQAPRRGPRLPGATPGPRPATSTATPRRRAFEEFRAVLSSPISEKGALRFETRVCECKSQNYRNTASLMFKYSKYFIHTDTKDTCKDCLFHIIKYLPQIC